MMIRFSQAAKTMSKASYNERIRLEGIYRPPDKYRMQCGYNISSDIRTFLLQFTHSKRMQYGISGHKSQFLPSLIFSVKLTIMVHRQKVELK